MPAPLLGLLAGIAGRIGLGAAARGLAAGGLRAWGTRMAAAGRGKAQGIVQRITQFITPDASRVSSRAQSAAEYGASHATTGRMGDEQVTEWLSNLAKRRAADTRPGKARRPDEEYSQGHQPRPFL